MVKSDRRVVNACHRLERPGKSGSIAAPTGAVAMVSTCPQIIDACFEIALFVQIGAKVDADYAQCCL